MKLPEALAPWQAWLAWFDADLASALGEFLRRLDPLLGPPAFLARGQLDPDGVEDLRRRGRYERLLLSEWAVADAAPDEFLRRAASGEHLFLAPRLVSRQADATLLALFDTGPAQWGAPRLAHIALWILLARRAQIARARFVWGALNAPGELHGTDSAQDLLRMLRARSSDVDAGQVAAWQPHLAAQAHGERWMIGAEPNAASACTHFARAALGFDDALHLRIGTRHRTHTARLALPPGHYATRLLRGRFTGLVESGTHQRVRGRLSLRRALVMSDSGEHVAVPLSGESRVVSLRIPPERTSRVASARYWQWPEGVDMIAGAMSGKAFGGVLLTSLVLKFWNMPGFGAVPRPSPQEFAVAPGQGGWLPCVWLRGADNVGSRVLLLDGAGRLIAWTLRVGKTHPASTECNTVETDVIALGAAQRGSAWFVSHAAGKLALKHTDTSRRVTAFAEVPSDTRPQQAWVCGNFKRSGWHDVAIAAGWGDSYAQLTCRVYQFHVQRTLAYAGEIALPHGTRGVGLIRDTSADRRPMLLCVRKDRRALVAIGANGGETIFESDSDIAAATVSGDGERVAVLLLSGELALLGDGGRTRLATVGSEASA